MPTIRLPIHLFQFTPLREGRQPKRGIRWQTMNFNSRPSARGDINRLQASQSSMYFNSRPSARGDPKFREAYIRAFISIHAPPRGATFPIPAFPKSCLISIHAPPRGATCTRQKGLYMNFISIHAPPRGATPTLRRFLQRWKFQFTPLREGRRRVLLGSGVEENISIHAPPRGATRQRVKFVPRYIFQFTPLREGRLIRATDKSVTIQFQFTPLREGRHNGKVDMKIILISIHAPPRGATPPSPPRWTP